MDAALLTNIIFLTCAVAAIGFSILVVFLKNPIYSSIFLVASFIPLAAIYLLMYAPFIAVIQILVYAGAIMVLFTFVIMMIDLQENEYEIHKSKIIKVIAFIVAFGFLGTMHFIAKELKLKDQQLERAELVKDIEGFGSTKAIGNLVFGNSDTADGEISQEATYGSMQIVSFELSSILIMVAIVGAVALAKRRRRGRI